MRLDRRLARLLLPLVAVAIVVLVGPLTRADAVAPAPWAVADTGHDHAPGTAHHTHVTTGVVAAAADGACGQLEALELPGVPLCTHGPDTAPAARAGNRPGEPVARRSASCIGSGTDGQRVQVLYVHGPDRPSASSGRVAAVRRWVEQVEWTVQASAERLGGERRVRWMTDGDCDVRVRSHRVSDRSLRDFERMVDELREDGYGRTDRSYLLFVDSSRYCGIATAPHDDDPTGNDADRTPGYARVDRPCWDSGDEGYHSIAAHELFHTLGAVQASAPNGTDGAHCTDEHDLLCYDDGTGEAVRVVCRDTDDDTSGAGDLNDRLLDCRGDDYFHPDPRSGSYLDRHWNTADAARLHDPEASRSSRASSGPPSPTGDPVGYVLYLVFGS